MVFASLFNVILIHFYSPTDKEKCNNKMDSTNSLNKVSQNTLRSKRHD